MTDLEMTRLCAEAMGYEYIYDGAEMLIRLNNERNAITKTPSYRTPYDPLHDDAQAMALVKKFHLMVGYSNGWSAQKRDENGDAVLQCGTFHYPDLNRAIVECVAKMQEAK